MSDNNKSENQEHVSDPSLLANEYLANERKKKGIDERDAADALKISVVRLRSIEEGDFTVFPSETYVRGHLRNYSRFLNVDEEIVVKAYDKANPPLFDFVNPENNAKEISTFNASSSKRPWILLLLIVILVALWVAAYSYFDKSSMGFDSLFSSFSSQSLTLEGSDVQSTLADIIESPEVDEVGVVLEDEVVASDSAWKGSGNFEEAANLTVNELVEEISVDGSNLSSDSSNIISDASSDISSERDQSVDAINKNLPEITSEQEISTLPLSGISESNIVVSKVTAAELVKSIMIADVSVPVEDIQPDAHVLTFSFSNPCWVKVTDADGTVIFAGLKVSGSALRLSGSAPFNIILGNVEGTNLAYNDKPVSLGKQLNGRPLRLVVGS